MPDNFGTPTLRDGLNEAAGLKNDASQFLKLRSLIIEHAPRGNGEPVMVIPGFCANGVTLLPMRYVFEKLGYKTYNWKPPSQLLIGYNLGPLSYSDKKLKKHARRIADRHGTGLKIAGQSFGGTVGLDVADDLAKSGLFGRVVTFGSPVHNDVLEEDTQHITPVMRTLFNKLNPPSHRRVKAFRGRMESIMEGGMRGTPVHSIYSQNDGVVGAIAAMNQWTGARKENYEIGSSHVGMGLHPAALLFALDRFALPAGETTPFDLSVYPAELQDAFLEDDETLYGMAPA